MIAGHFGFAAAVKSRARSAPLWMLMLASVWLDIVFVPLFIGKRETLELVPGHHGYGAGIIHADYTHSVVGMLLLSLLLGLVSWPFWGGRNALVIGLVAVSHWVLDLIVHRPDMPVYPGQPANWPHFGFGLWQYPLAAQGLELLLVIGGAALYWQAAQSVSRDAGKGPFWPALSAVLIAAFGALVLWMDATA